MAVHRQDERRAVFFLRCTDEEVCSIDAEIIWVAGLLR